MGRPVKKLALAPEEKAELRNRVRAKTTSQRDSLRARIILERAQGKKAEEVARQLSVSVTCVSKWSSRFETEGLAGLKDAIGRGRKPSLPKEKIEQVLTKVTQPPKGRRRWSVRTMARAVGISHDSVQRIWKANDLKPHLTRTFKLSRDPDLEAKFWDVIGLYLNPPDKALVLCCDEKSQCQALERTQPGLPLGTRHIETQTHDYYRLMELMGIEAIYPKPRLSQAGEGHKIYPYLLKGVGVERADQVWSTDITYIRMAQGFVYLVAVTVSGLRVRYRTSTVEFASQTWTGSAGMF